MRAHAEAAIAVPATRSGLSSPVFLIDPGKGLGSEPESYLNRKSHSLRIRLVIIRSRADPPRWIAFHRTASLFPEYFRNFATLRRDEAY